MADERDLKKYGNPVESTTPVRRYGNPVESTTPVRRYGNPVETPRTRGYGAAAAPERTRNYGAAVTPDEVDDAARKSHRKWDYGASFAKGGKVLNRKTWGK